MLRKRRPIRVGRILLLLALVAGAIYINSVIVPTTPPLFVPTQTPTRAPDSYIADADTLAQQGKYLQSIQTYQEAIQVDPRNANNYVNLARIQIYNMQYKDAQTSAENALLLNNNNPQAHAIRGWALTLQDDFLPAEASIKRALELDNNNALAHAFYAELYMRMIAANQAPIGAVEKAADESKLALALAPDIMETHRARGIVLMDTSNYEQSITEFQTAIQLNPNLPDLHMDLGLAYRALDPPQYDKAVEEFTRANALNPADPMPETYIARTYVTIGEYAKAIQYAEQAMKDAPSDPYMWGNLGTMYYRNMQYPEAIAALTLAVRGGNTPDGTAVVKGLPLDYGRIAEYYYLYGLALAKENNCNEAIQISQMLLQTVSQDETAAYNADAMVKICQANLIGTATPGPDSTSGPNGETPTETPTP